VGLAFGKDRRLRKHAEFVQAKRLGRRVGTAHFTLLVAPQPGEALAARLGIVAARTVGGAVARNRVKRLCRECFRTWPGLLPPGVDLIVIARPGAPGLALTEVRSEWGGVERLLRKRAEEALARARTTHHPGGD
jgi:ribonuclease P protein component